MVRNFSRFVVVAALAAATSGCEDTRRALGIDKSIPDEFAVVARAPLVMPPDFNLRPPAPGAERPQEGTSTDRARVALVGRDRMAPYRARGFSPGELTLLDMAGLANVPPNIRDTIDRETSAFAAEERGFTDRLIFWKDGGGSDGAPLDPVAEKKRLDENAAQGKKANEGPVPTISRGGRVLGVF